MAPRRPAKSKAQKKESLTPSSAKLSPAKAKAVVRLYQHTKSAFRQLIVATHLRPIEEVSQNCCVRVEALSHT